jgi:outer membrane receptor for ferrienterochelin and colicins
MKKNSTFIIPFIFLNLAGFAQADTSKLKVFSELSLEELLNVEVVTASGNIQKLIEAPATMRVITSQQIQERGYEELDDALRDIPGLDLQHVGGQFPTIRTFRGMSGDQNSRVLLMIDGIIENSIIGSFEMGGPAYSLHNVERIEIIWGPGSALYGANAYSAIINIITMKGAYMNGLQYQKGFGSYNSSLDKLMLGVKKSNWDIALAGSLFKTDGPRYSNRDPNYIANYVDNAWSFNGKIENTFKKFKTTLGFRAYETPTGLGTRPNSPTKILGLPSQGNENTGTQGTIASPINGEKPSLWDPFSRTVFLQNEFLLNTKFSIFSRLQFRETGVSEKSYAYSQVKPNLVSKNLRAHYSNRLRGEVSGSYVLSEMHSFFAGVQYSQDNLEVNYRGVNPDNRIDTINYIPITNIRSTYKKRVYNIQNNTGAYLQYVLNTNFLNKTNLTIGGRYDNNSVYGSSFNPRIGIINQPNKRIAFKLLYGSAYRPPTNFELYNTTPLKVANPDLTPERIRTYEFNFAYTASLFVFQTNLFRNELFNVIVEDVPLGNGFNQNANSGSATINGFEVKLDIVPVKDVTVFANFTYQEGTLDKGDKIVAMPNIARVKGNIGTSVYIARLFTVNLICNWVGERSVPESNPLGKVNGYFITNMAITTKKLFNDHVSASLNIRNLFNQTYYDPGANSAEGNLFSTVLEQPGINGLFKINFYLF